MRLLILGSGKSFHATRWANALVKAGIDIAFTSIHDIERPLSSAVELFQLSTRGSTGYLLDVGKLINRIKKWRPDLLHVHFATGYGLMGKLSGFTKRIVSVYGTDIYDFPKKSILHKAILQYNLSGASATLSTSESMADEYLRMFPTHRRPVVTPFGVDINKFKPIGNANLVSKTLNIGIVKKLESKYGIDVLIDAFGMLRTMLPAQELKLHIVGAGSKEWDLKKRCAALDLEEFVCFYGSIPNENVPDFLNRLDIFVVPSRSDSESFGVAAVEAQACGLPVVVSNVGGLTEVVKHEKTGLVVSKEDPRALADALRMLCERPLYRKSLGLSARQRVVELYNWENNVEQMVGIYQKVMREK